MRTLRVLTLNIWNRSGPWEQRLALIRAGLGDLQPDLIGLQEVLRPDDGPGQSEAIADGLGYGIAYGVAWDAGGGITLGNALLARYPITRTEARELPKLDAAEPRSLLYAEVASPFGQVPCFVTHLSWRLDEGHVREAQVKAIARHVKELAPVAAFPAILMGDFNATAQSDEIRYLSGLTSLGTQSTYFCDTFGELGHGDGFTFSHRNPYAADLREPERRIDYIFVRAPDAGRRGEPLDARVVFDRARDGVYASDHYGVCATLRAEG